MKAKLLKRLEALEQAANRATTRLLVLIDVTKLPEADREAYWSGDDAVLQRYAARDGAEMSQGTIIHTLVISVHPKLRQEWLATVNLDEDDLEAHEQRAILREQRREREARDAQERSALEAVRDAGRVRYDYSGYPIRDHSE